MNEKRLIESILEYFPRSSEQINKSFACDSELIQIGDQLWGISMDEFSEEEDMFTLDNPEQLGANLATATLSDLWAAGVTPKFFMQTICISPDLDSEFINKFCKGVGHILQQAGCFLCGGDIGSASSFRFTGVALGEVKSKPLTRKIPKSPQVLWVTGELGEANLAAMQKQTMPVIEPRIQESFLINELATACMDTSGGFFESIMILAEQNIELRFEIDLDSLPIAKMISEFSQVSGVPIEAALYGGAGEYELLFTTDEDIEQAQKDRLTGAGITPVGRVFPSEKAEVIVSRQGNSNLLLPVPCPRSFSIKEEYIHEVLSQARRLAKKLSNNDVKNHGVDNG